MDADTYRQLRRLLDEYLRMYASRDDKLTTQFSEDFSGFTGGGDFLVKDRERWVGITRQDFSQVKEPLRLELKDVAIQSLGETVAVATSFFTIHLPIKDHVLSRETARLVLIFRREPSGWKISHSSISIPYYGVRDGEVYPLNELADRNRALERIVAERTKQLYESALALNRAQAMAHIGNWELIFHQTGTHWSGSTELRSIYGYPPDKQLTMQSGIDLVHPDDRKLLAEHWHSFLRGEASDDWEHRIVVEGQIKWLQIRAQRQFASDGRLAKVTGTVQDITARKQVEDALRTKNAELSSALAHVRTLSGLLPICCSCKKIRNDKNYWEQVEVYVMKHTDAKFSHGYCPDCLKKYFPGIDLPESS